MEANADTSLMLLFRSQKEKRQEKVNPADHTFYFHLGAFLLTLFFFRTSPVANMLRQSTKAVMFLKGLFMIPTSAKLLHVYEFHYVETCVFTKPQKPAWVASSAACFF